jgi:hypothetical protein
MPLVYFSSSVFCFLSCGFRKTVILLFINAAVTYTYFHIKFHWFFIHAFLFL